MHRLRIGDVQHGGLTIYVFDVAVNDPEVTKGAPFPGALEAQHLLVEVGREEDAWKLLVDGANSADATADGSPPCREDAAMRDALSALASRVLRLAPRAP